MRDGVMETILIVYFSEIGTKRVNRIGEVCGMGTLQRSAAQLSHCATVPAG